MQIASVVRVNDDETVAGDVRVDIYKLTKYTRSNQNPTSNQRPIVKQGERLAKATWCRRRLHRLGRARGSART